MGNKLKIVSLGVLGFLLLLTYQGCGGLGQQVLSGQAKVVMNTQPARYDLYGTEHTRCINESRDFVKYKECMSLARSVARAADAYAVALEGAQAAYKAGGAKGFREAFPCVAQAAKRLVDALQTASLPVPEAVEELASYLSERLGECK